MALTVTDGTHSVTSVDTITLNSAGTVSGGSSHATITGSDPVKVYLPGGLGTDSGGATSTIATYDIASRTGSTINITWFENNAGIPTSTEGYYLTLARAESVGGTATCNVDEILAAALLYSHTSGVAIYVPAGTYELTGAVSQQVLLTNTALIGAPNFQTTFTLAFDRSGSTGAFLVSGDNVLVQDIVVAGANASYVNFLTNQPVSVSGSAATASPFDWQTVSIGDLGGTNTLALDGVGWQLSSNPELIPTKGALTILFDQLPAGQTVESLNGSLAASGTLTASHVLWNYCVVQGVTVASVTEPESPTGTYTLTLHPYIDPSDGTTHTLSRDGFTPRLALDPVTQTISNPDYLAQPALPPAFIQFTKQSSPPTYYTGDCFHITGSFASFRNVACMGVTSGNAYLGACLSPRFTNTHCLATFGDGGSGGFRFTGLGAIFDGCVVNSGDDGVQQSQQPMYDPHYLNSSNNPSYGFTQSTFAERWIGCEITTIGTGRACAIDLDTNPGPSGTPLTWPSNSTTFSPSSVQFSASDVPAGLTLSMLGASYQPWAPSFAYDTMDTRVVNKGNIYSLSVTGTSAASGGPTSTGTTVSIDGSCQWDYLSAGETIYIYDSALAGTEPGAFVTGYTESGGTVTVTATAPLINFTGTWTTTTEPFTDYETGTDFVLLLSNSDGSAAIPPMALDNSADLQFERCTFRSIVPEVALIGNRNSFGTARAAFHGCTFDGSWSLDVADNSGAMMQIKGNPIAGSGGADGGGCRVTVDECRFYAPAVACISSLGLNSYIGIFRSELYPPTVVADQMANNVVIAGASQFDFVENTVWAPQANEPSTYAVGVVTLGGPATSPASSVGLVLPGSASNARIVGNRFLALYSIGDVSTPGLTIDYADAVFISNNIFAAGTNPPAATVTGIAITSNATNVISVGNSFETCPVAYSGTLTQLSINGTEIYDSGGEGYVKPPAPSYPGLTSSVGTWTPTLSCGLNPLSLTVVYDTSTTFGKIIRTPLSDGTFKNDVQFSVSGTCSSTGTPAPSGDLRVYGLPYTSVPTADQGVSICPPISDFTWVNPTGMLVWAVQFSDVFLSLDNLSSGVGRTREQITSVIGTFTLSGFGYYLSID